MSASQFSVAEATGNTLVGGTLGVTGTSTMAAINASGLLSLTNDFKISSATPLLWLIDTTAANTGFFNYVDNSTWAVASATDAGAKVSDWLTIARATGAVTIPGTLGVTGDITASSGAINLGAGNGFVQTATNAVAEIALNFVGYAGGTTQFRNFGVYDGKNASVFSIVGSTKAATFQGTLGVTGNVTASSKLMVSTSSLSGAESVAVNQAVSGDWLQINKHTHASSPIGIWTLYSAAAPNDTTHQFAVWGDSGATRAEMRSNGGLANFSANNVNLSDIRTKKDIQPAGDYLPKIMAIPVKTFLYKDQTDADLNLGVIAQDVEAVAPELIDNSGFGETPEDGIPLKTIYQTDLQYALMKALQELAADFQSYKDAHP
jgi:hypothetical protein